MGMEQQTAESCMHMAYTASRHHAHLTCTVYSLMLLQHTSLQPSKSIKQLAACTVYTRSSGDSLPAMTASHGAINKDRLGKCHSADLCKTDSRKSLTQCACTEALLSWVPSTRHCAQCQQQPCHHLQNNHTSHASKVQHICHK